MVSRLTKLDEQVKKLMARDQVAAYVEYAREMIVEGNNCGDWAGLVDQARKNGTNEQLINGPASRLFQIDSRAWKTVSVDYYTNSRNSEIHSITETGTIVLGLLAHLPAQFKNARAQASFSQLIRAVAAYRELAAYVECAKDMIADTLSSTYESNREWDDTYCNWDNVAYLVERKVIPWTRVVHTAKELFDFSEQEWTTVEKFIVPRNKRDSVRQYGVLEDAESAKQLVDTLPAQLRTNGRDQTYKKLIDAVSAKLS